MNPEVLEELLDERYSSLNSDVIPGILDDIENMKEKIAAEDAKENIAERTTEKNGNKDRSHLVIYDPVFKANYEYLID